MLLPSGDADLWMRKNITEIAETKETAAGYEADEAYMRTTATEAEIAADFEGWFETASNWQPPQPEKKPDTQEGRIAALEETVKDLKEKNASLAEELEAAKIILGVE